MRTERVSRKVSAWRARVRPTLLSVAILLLAFAILLWPRVGSAAPCARGVNCYCDRVKNPSNSIYDPNLLMCEDFEAPTLHDNVGFGNGSPDFGPWYDATGQSDNRGANSYWAKTYGNGVGACLWGTNEPASPSLGSACTGFANCTGTKVWHPSDLWQANNLKPCKTILKNGEFGSEMSTINPPTGSAGGGSGVFDGQQSHGHRNDPSFGGDAGISGGKNFPGGAQRTFGITMAVAYPNNSAGSGIWAQAWKHNEWNIPSVGAPGPGEGLFLFHNTSRITTQIPFEHFIFWNGDNNSTCNTKLAAATKTVGDFLCNPDTAVYYRADPTVYSQPTDWPFGSWACVRGYFQNIGTTTSAIQIWVTGPSGVEKKIIDISNWDLTGTNAQNGFIGFSWNNYANTNFDNGQDVHTVYPTFRYEDNVHIRAGAPVSCSQIGFSATLGGTPAPGTAPAAPSGLTVR